MSERKISRIVIEFFTDSDEEHKAMCESIAEHADDTMCPEQCDMDSCRLVGLTYRRMTLDEYDKEIASV